MVAHVGEPRPAPLVAARWRTAAAFGASTVAVALGALSCLLWLVANAATDLWLWSQFLWWTPWFAYVAACLPAMVVALCASRGRRRAWARACALGAIVIAGIGLWRDVGFRSSPDGKALSLIQWNASWPDFKSAAIPSGRLLAEQADVVVISNPFRLFAPERLEEWRSAGYDVRNFGLFAIASRVPVIDARMLFSTEGCSALVCTVDARDTIGGPITVLALDLPSNPRQSRMSVVRECAALLGAHSFPEPDLVVGDFNITRGSASIDLLAPGLHDSWAEGGHGWGASWPRTMPILHLDHVLLAPHLEATLCRFVDPGIKTHRAQAVRIRARASGPFGPG